MAATMAMPRSCRKWLSRPMSRRAPAPGARRGCRSAPAAGPQNAAAGCSRPEMLPSKLFQRTMLASAKRLRVDARRGAGARPGAVAGLRRPASAPCSVRWHRPSPRRSRRWPDAGRWRARCPPAAGAGRSLSVRASNRRSLAAVDVDARGQQLAVPATASWSTSQGMCADTAAASCAAALVAVDLAELAATIAEHPLARSPRSKPAAKCTPLSLLPGAGSSCVPRPLARSSSPPAIRWPRGKARQHRLAVVRRDAADVPAGAGQLATQRWRVGSAGSISVKVWRGCSRVPPCVLRSSGTELISSWLLRFSQVSKPWRRDGSVSSVTLRVAGRGGRAGRPRRRRCCAREDG